MNDLANDEDIFNILKTDEVESLREDIDYINSKIDKQTDDFFEITPVNQNFRGNDEDIFNILKTDEVESLREDIDYINSKIDKQTDDFFEITPVNQNFRGK